MNPLNSIVARIAPGAPTVRPLTLDDAFAGGERYGRVEVGGRPFEAGMLACEKRIADAIAAAFAEIRAEVSRMRGASAEEAAER